MSETVTNYTPPWKSYQQTGNPADIVQSPAVAGAIGNKVDATGGQAENLEVAGGKLSGTDISAAALSDAMTGAEAAVAISSLSSLDSNQGAGTVHYSQVSTYPSTSVAYALSGFRSVKSAPYGAAGDGTTDDTAVVNAARADIKSAGGGCTYYPPAAGYLVSGRTRHPGILIEDKDFPAFDGPEPPGQFRVYAVNKGEYGVGMTGIYSFMTSGSVNTTPFNTLGGTDSVALSGIVYSGSDVTNSVCACNIISRYAGLPPGINWGIEIDMNNESPTAYDTGDARGGQGLVLNTGSTYSPDTGVVVQRVAGEGTGPGWKQGVVVKGAREAGVVVEAMAAATYPAMSPAATGAIAAYVARVSGDTVNRYIVSESGEISWSAGSGAVDTVLGRRSAGNGLTLTGGLDVSGNLNVGGTIGAQQYWVGSNPVVGARQSAISDAASGTEVTTINLILAALRAHGLIAT